MKDLLLKKKEEITAEFDALQKSKESMEAQIKAIDNRHIQLRAQNALIKQLLEAIETPLPPPAT